MADPQGGGATGGDAFTVLGRVEVDLARERAIVLADAAPRKGKGGRNGASDA